MGHYFPLLEVGMGLASIRLGSVEWAAGWRQAPSLLPEGGNNGPSTRKSNVAGPAALYGRRLPGKRLDERYLRGEVLALQRGGRGAGEGHAPVHWSLRREGQREEAGPGRGVFRCAELSAGPGECFPCRSGERLSR